MADQVQCPNCGGFRVTNAGSRAVPVFGDTYSNEEWR